MSAARVALSCCVRASVLGYRYTEVRGKSHSDSIGSSWRHPIAINEYIDGSKDRGFAILDWFSLRVETLSTVNTPWVEHWIIGGSAAGSAAVLWEGHGITP